MPVEDRRARERAARRGLILRTARRIAEAEGWDAVTTRRLSTEIEYSQPVLYSHFANMDQLAQAVAIEGFREFAAMPRTAHTGTDALKEVVRGYLDFARQNPALYDVMFTRPTTLHFAAEDTPHELVAAFTELRDAVAAVGQHDDPDTVAEVLWSALHGLVTLSRSGRLRASHESERIDLLIAQFCRTGPG